MQIAREKNYSTAPTNYMFVFCWPARLMPSRAVLSKLQVAKLIDASKSTSICKYMKEIRAFWPSIPIQLVH